MKVMLLAAGRGERMGQLTERTPKPLLPVANKPLLWHHLTRLQQTGFKDVVINTSYLGEQIRDYVGDGSEWGLNVQCTYEQERLETAGGIVNALPLLGEEPFLVVNGDIWIDYPLDTVRQKISGWAHLVLVDNPPHNIGGDFGYAESNGSVSASVGTSERIPLTFSGLSVLSPALFVGCEPGKAPLAPLLRAAMEKGQVTGEHYSGLWIDVGTPERLQQVATLLSSA